MIKNLSKREKVMLYVLLIVAIIAGGFYLLIRPTVDSYLAREDELAELEAQQMEMKMAIAQIDGLKRDIDEIGAELEQYWSRLAPPLYNDELDHQITGMLLEYQLLPVSLAMEDMAEQPILPYGVTEETAGGGEEDKATPTLLANYTGVACIGSLNDLLRFIDRLDREEAIELLALEIDFSGEVYELGAEMTEPDAERVLEFGAPDPNLVYAYSLQLATYMSVGGELGASNK